MEKSFGRKIARSRNYLLAVTLLATAGLGWWWIGPGRPAGATGDEMAGGGGEENARREAEAGGGHPSRDRANRDHLDRAQYLALERLKDEIRALEMARVIHTDERERDHPVTPEVRRILNLPESVAARTFIERSVILIAPSAGESEAIRGKIEEAFRLSPLSGAVDREGLRQRMLDEYLNYPKAYKHLGTAMLKVKTRGSRATVTPYNFDELIERPDPQDGSPGTGPRYPEDVEEGMEKWEDPRDPVERYGYLFGLTG